VPPGLPDTTYSRLFCRKWHSMTLPCSEKQLRAQLLVTVTRAAVHNTSSALPAKEVASLSHWLLSQQGYAISLKQHTLSF
jgi:hypothetical protein